MVSTSYAAAPAAIGATTVGVTPVIKQIDGGVVVFGEDYVASCSPLSSVNTTWATVAGFPLSPYSLGPNTLAEMSRIYSEYRIRRARVCFIPAVGTAANGQVALYRKSARLEPHVDPNSSTFLSFVLNQRTGVVGPVWQPCHFDLTPDKDWRTTTPLLNVDPNDEVDGEVFVATNNSAATGVAPSIGIVKLFYEWEFRDFRRNPRLSLIPTLMQVYFQMSIGTNGANVTLGNDATGLTVFGNDQTGSPSALPSNKIDGDIYKFVVDVNRTSFGAATPSNLIGERILSGNRALVMENGFTCYVLYFGGVFGLYPTFIAAVAATTPFVWGITNASLTFNMVGSMSRVGNILNANNADI
jgi:hypothetical protein